MARSDSGQWEDWDRSAKKARKTFANKKQRGRRNQDKNYLRNVVDDLRLEQQKESYNDNDSSEE